MATARRLVRPSGPPAAPGSAGRPPGGPWARGCALVCLAAFLGLARGPSLAAAQAPLPEGVFLIKTVKTVEISRAGATVWDPVTATGTPGVVLYPGDRLRTGEGAQAAILMRDRALFRLDELTQITLPPEKAERPSLNLLRGLIYFFNRDQPGKVQVETPQVAAAVLGTEFLLGVGPDGTSTLLLLEGEVNLTNSIDGLPLRSGQAAIIEPGQPPRLAPGIVTTDPRHLQWCLYYPVVLVPADLGLSEAPAGPLASSLAAYERGDLRAALADCPPASDADPPALRVYRAALELGHGQTARAERALIELAQHPGVGPLARALRLLVSAVQFRVPATASPEAEAALTATEHLARSYAAQSHGDLSRAFLHAQRACALASGFGPAWARLAELEFGFGRIRAAQKALDRARSLAPRDAQGAALEGFLHAAQNRVGAARQGFQQAIALDPGLANAWLGRGLIRIRGGDVAGGRQDLQIAAAMEPQRASLRSYLGKALEAAGDTSKALHELALAQALDPRDPTPWLYAALVRERQNQIHLAIRDLETSQALNESRALYRSRLLLDQDRAVRSANLARLYQDAGLAEWSVREASRSVAADYANHSSHLFLAQSYLNSDRVNLRLETARVSEFLLANLLAPPGAGVLSPAISQGEYSRLFERSRLGFVSQSDYASDGGWSLAGAVYGNTPQSGFALGGLRQESPGYRPNNDLRDRNVLFQAAQQVTPEDVLYLQTGWSERDQGDLVEYYSPQDAHPSYRQRESISPLLLAGWQHAWNPENRTLLLAAHAQQEVEVHDPLQPLIALVYNFDGSPRTNRLGVMAEDLAQDYRLANVEAQHIRQTQRHTTVLGARYQSGDVQSDLDQGPNSLYTLPHQLHYIPQGRFTSETRLDRVTAYAYHSWQLTPWLQTVAGLAYDRLTHPLNYRHAPLSDLEDTTDQLGPKFGLVLTPAPDLALRAAYTRSLGGVSVDQSLRLEPTQVAGLNQAYRSLIPESAAGVLSAATFETAQAALEYKPLPNTYLTASAEWLSSSADRHLGAYAGYPPLGLQPVLVPESLEFDERSLGVAVHHLLNDWASVGVQYRWSLADLERSWPRSASAYSDFPTASHEQALLQQVVLVGLVNHPCGFFGEFDALWTSQDARADLAAEPGDSFWQFHVYAGYRWWQRRLELRVGILNLADQDYRLHPLNLYSGLARERTFVARLRLAF